jgi:hypothetical protein
MIAAKRTINLLTLSRTKMKKKRKISLREKELKMREVNLVFQKKMRKCLTITKMQ